jgi:hypothetical protein
LLPLLLALLLLLQVLLDLAVEVGGRRIDERVDVGQRG